MHSSIQVTLVDTAGLRQTDDALESMGIRKARETLSRSDIAVVGDEAAVDAELERIAAAGVTDFNAAIIAGNEEDRQRTMDYLASKV